MNYFKKKGKFKRFAAMFMACTLMVPTGLATYGEKVTDNKSKMKTIIDENINEYGDKLGSKWIVPEDSKEKITLVMDGDEKVIKIVGKDGNSMLYYDEKFGDNITTYDIKFSEGVIYYEGMYNIVAENGDEKYCTNITPDDNNDMVIESKNASVAVNTRIKKGISKEVWYTCKTQVLNGNISMKVWPKNEAEPASWDLQADFNDSSELDKVLKFEMFSWNDRQNFVYLKNIKVEEFVKSEFYVDINGNDNNPGTKDAPFKTLERARDAVRAVNDNMTCDIVVNVGEGVFELNRTFELTAEDSGTNGYKVIYKGAGKENTVISGGVKIAGWSLHDEEKNIYKASVADGMDFRQLYVDGVKAIRARSGEVGTYGSRILGAERIKDGEVLPELLVEDSAKSREQADDGTIFIATEDNTFSNTWNNLSDIELHIFTAWSVNVLRVKSAQLNGNQYDIKVGDEEAELVFNRQHPNIDGYSHMSTRRFIYYVENAYELMDQDNEWYLDKSSNTLYYKAPTGMNMAEKEVVAPMLETIVKVSGTLDEPVENIVFSNMGFMYSTWMKPTKEGFVDGQAMQYVTRTVFSKNDVGIGRPSAGIVVMGANGIVFDNNKISDMGATGIDLYWGASDCTISNNIITNISGNGVSVGKFASDDQVDYHVAYNPEDEREVCTNDMIINNEITYIGTDYECAVGIAAGYPKKILIANNTIAFAPYSGISLGFGWTRNSNAMSENRILRNEIYNVSNVLCDAGGIYTLSEQSGSEMWGNYIHDIVLQPWADYGTCGIYLDEGTGGYYITNNVIEKAFDITSHVTGINRIKDNYINKNGVTDTDIVNKIKEKAGVQENLDLSELENVPGIEDLPEFTYKTIFEDDFNGYEAGNLDEDKWIVSDDQKALVNIASESAGNVLKITSNNANTKVYANLAFGNNVTTFDFNFVDGLTNFDGMYNVIRRSSVDYTSNLTPAFSSTVRLETKGSDEVGIHKEFKDDTWYTCKTMVYNSTMYMKVWKKGTAEPAEWDILKDMNDATNNDCMLGLEFYAGNGKSMYVDNVKIQSISLKSGENEDNNKGGSADKDNQTPVNTTDTVSKIPMMVGIVSILTGILVMFFNIMYKKKRIKE